MATLKPCIQILPENIILEIFNYLNIKERCKICRVCRQWNRIIHDKKLWRHVDLTEHPLNLTKMWKIIRAHFSDCLISLKMKGFMYMRNVGPKGWKKATISDAMLKDLDERCPNLRELCLMNANLESMKFDCFPAKLKKLTISSSCVPLGKPWLSEKFIPELTHLDLSSTPAVQDKTLLDLGVRPKIISLKLNSCYRLGSQQLFDTFFERFPNLESLELIKTKVQPSTIHHICRNCLKLKHLNLSGCQEVTDVGFANIVDCLITLESLILSMCNIQINRNHVSGFKKLKNLTMLDIKGNTIPDDARESLRLYLPNTEIITSEVL